MCAAVGLSIPAMPANVQQTVPLAAFSVRFTIPWPVGEPLGTSTLPVSLAPSSGCIEAIARAGRAPATTAHARNIRILIEPPLTLNDARQFPAVASRVAPRKQRLRNVGPPG